MRTLKAPPSRGRALMASPYMPRIRYNTPATCGRTQHHPAIAFTAFLSTSRWNIKCRPRLYQQERDGRELPGRGGDEADDVERRRQQVVRADRGRLESVQLNQLSLLGLGLRCHMSTAREGSVCEILLRLKVQKEEAKLNHEWMYGSRVLA